MMSEHKAGIARSARRERPARALKAAKRRWLASMVTGSYQCPRSLLEGRGGAAAATIAGKRTTAAPFGPQAA